jgi:hypothetical protein
MRILRSSRYFSIFRHRYEPSNVITTEKPGNLKIFLILCNHAFLLLALTRTPYHAYFPVKEERNDFYGSCAHVGVKTIQRQDTQCMYIVTLSSVLATIHSFISIQP